MKMSGNYDILSFEYRPFAEGAEKREMPWDSPRETAFTWRGINLDSFDQLGSLSANTANQISQRWLTTPGLAA